MIQMKGGFQDGRCNWNLEWETRREYKMYPTDV
jgi:hypothetical protein